MSQPSENLILDIREYLNQLAHKFELQKEDGEDLEQDVILQVLEYYKNSKKSIDRKLVFSMVKKRAIDWLRNYFSDQSMLSFNNIASDILSVSSFENSVLDRVQFERYSKSLSTDESRLLGLEALQVNPKEKSKKLGFRLSTVYFKSYLLRKKMRALAAQ